jgi:hypothetical protein
MAIQFSINPGDIACMWRDVADRELLVLYKMLW